MTHEEATLQTKTALAASLKKFMKKKPLGKITVSEIITDCNVNRKTFYYHFEDIYALLKWMLEQEAIEVVKNFDLLIDYEDAIRFVIRYVEENAHILNCAYDSMGRDELKRFFYNDFVSLVKNVVDDTEERCGLSVTNDFKNFLCDFLTEATAGMLVNGFKEKSKFQQSDVVCNITVILNSLPDMLRRAPQKSIN
jgi:probable dihydroxyacetone kinase regulator